MFSPWARVRTSRSTMRPCASSAPTTAAATWATTGIVVTALLCFIYNLDIAGWQQQAQHKVADVWVSSSLEHQPSQSGHHGQVVHIPDLHGDAAQGKSVLAMMGLIDEAGHWTGGNTVLVQTGDIVDRGPQSLELLHLFANLSVEAPATGGRVVNLLGNHELMLLQHDFRYFNRDELAGLTAATGRSPAAGKAATGLQEGRAQLAELLQPQGWLGQLLRSRPIAYISRGVSCRGCACDILFIHAAALPWMVSSTLVPLDTRGGQQQAGNTSSSHQADALVQAWNEAVSRELAGCSGKQCGRSSGSLAEKLLGSDGGVWSRAYTEQPLSQVCTSTQQVIKALQVSRVVVGHTIVRGGQAAVLCDGALIMADIGMSTAYGGKLGRGIALRCGPGGQQDGGDVGDGPNAHGLTMHYGQGPGRVPLVVSVKS